MLLKVAMQPHYSGVRCRSVEHVTLSGADRVVQLDRELPISRSKDKTILYTVFHVQCTEALLDK